MPRQFQQAIPRLEDQCVQVYLSYLYGEVMLISQLRAFERQSVLLKQHGLMPDKLLNILQYQLSSCLTGIVHDIVRQKFVNMIIGSMSHLIEEHRQFQQFQQYQSPQCRFFLLPSSRAAATGSSLRSPVGSSCARTCEPSPMQNAHAPLLQLFQLVISKDIRYIDMSKNKDWPDTDQLQVIARSVWKIIGDKVCQLQRFVVPKEIGYSSAIDRIIINSSNLTHLTLKRNVPTNVFLSLIGTHCANLKHFDIAGAEVVTDFGIVCLLFKDYEQIFIECWHREKTVGSGRRSQRAFPHPYFDKPIPDPTDAPACARNSSQYLHLKRTFHDVIREDSFQWERLPICGSLQKVRLENTKVKGDGASVLLHACPNLYSLGYLVFAAAGLKQAFGYEQRCETNLTEIFYRGPSDQKLQTIANCCPKLAIMFLGSNSLRRMNVAVFSHWPHLEYLTLENIIEEDVSGCLRLLGHQLKGLKIQCSGLDLTDVFSLCPNLVSLVIQKEVPHSSVNAGALSKGGARPLQHLQFVEITCMSFPKACFNFVMRNAPQLRSMKAFHVSGLKREDVESWTGSLNHLETLVLFKAPELTRDAVDVLLDITPSLRTLGDLSSFDLKRPGDTKRISNKILEEHWDLHLIDTETTLTQEDKDFSRLLSLHWFYLTECSEKAKNSNSDWY